MLFGAAIERKKKNESFDDNNFSFISNKNQTETKTV